MSDSKYRDIRKREKRCVCRQCGSPLEAHMIVFCEYGGQGVELYCPSCDRIEYGCEPEIYDLARKFVEDFEFNYFVDMAEGERNIQLNTSKVCELFTWLFKETEMCTRDGIIDEVKAIAKLPER